MTTAQRIKQVCVSFVLIACGCLFYWASKRAELKLSDEEIVLMQIGALMPFAYGCANLLFLMQPSMGTGSALMILVGCFVLVISAMAGSILFALVGGFMAVIGTLFFLRKRTC